MWSPYKDPAQPLYSAILRLQRLKVSQMLARLERLAKAEGQDTAKVAELRRKLKALDLEIK